MKKIYSHESIVTINHLRNLLQAEGVPAIVRNERLLGAIGEVPFMECWPQLWVVHDLQAEHALRLIRDALAAPSGETPEWTCERCGERIEGHFAVCWNCGGEAPAL